MPRPANTASNDIEKHDCPFPECHSSYTKRQNLKTHLITIRGTMYDHKHPQHHPIWKKLDDENFLVRHSRPGDLSKEDIAQRRSQTQKLHYERNKASILQHQRKRREVFYENLQLTSQVAQRLDQVTDQITDLRNQINQVRKLFSCEASYRLDQFVDTSTGITYATFPHFIAYYLPFQQTPDFLRAIPGETRIFDIIPGATHYQKTSLLIHPDRSATEIQQLLNDSWDLWKEVLETEELEAEYLFDYQDASSYDDFVAKGPDHQKLAEMLSAWMHARTTATGILRPPTLTVWALECALSGSTRENISHSGGSVSDDDFGETKSLVHKALDEVSTLAKKRKRRRRKETIDERHSMNNGFHTDGEDYNLPVDPAIC